MTHLDVTMLRVCSQCILSILSSPVVHDSYVNFIAWHYFVFTQDVSSLVCVLRALNKYFTLNYSVERRFVDTVSRTFSLLYYQILSVFVFSHFCFNDILFTAD